MIIYKNNREQFIQAFVLKYEEMIRIKRTTDILFCCVGTQKSILANYYDCVGPVVGYILSKYVGHIHPVLGHLLAPLNAYSLGQKEIEDYINNKTRIVIAIDANIWISDKANIIKTGSLYPGSADEKEINPIGDISILMNTMKQSDYDSFRAYTNDPPEMGNARFETYPGNRVHLEDGIKQALEIAYCILYGLTGQDYFIYQSQDFREVIDLIRQYNSEIKSKESYFNSSYYTDLLEQIKRP